MARVEALVTPSVMRWARIKARLSLEEASAKIKRSVDEIEAWEEGTARPTIAQARKASEVYKRPLAVFYLPEPPQDFDTLRDFRSLPDADLQAYSPGLALLIRHVYYQQAWMRDYLADEGEAPLAFVGSASLAVAPRDVALSILDVLDITPEAQKKCTSRYEALRLWIDKAEAAGIFVFRQAHIAPAEARGFVLSDDLAPFIFVNSADSASAQIFTLAHELAHLWLNQSGISNLEAPHPSSTGEIDQIEIFCNRVAAEATLEEDAFLEVWHNQRTSSSLDERILSLSGTFKVSEEVVARRLLDSGFIDQAEYLKLRALYQDRWKKQKARKKEKQRASGGGDWYRTMVASNGYNFTRTVVSAFVAGVISGRDASSLLNVKVNNIGRLAETAGIPGNI